MSCAVTSPPNPLSMNPIVFAYTAPVKATVSVPEPVPVPEPVRPAFNWRNTTDRLREGLHCPLPFENDEKVRRHRRSVFLEMGLHGYDEEVEEEAERGDGKKCDDLRQLGSADFRKGEDADENGSTSAGGGGDDAHQCAATANASTARSLRTTSGNTRKRFSWPLVVYAAEFQPPPLISSSTDAPPDTSMSSARLSSLSSVSTHLSASPTWPTAMTTSTTTELCDRKRPWYAKLRGSGKTGSRRLRQRSLQPFVKDQS